MSASLCLGSAACVSASQDTAGSPRRVRSAQAAVRSRRECSRSLSSGMAVKARRFRSGPTCSVTPRSGSKAPACSGKSRFARERSVSVGHVSDRFVTAASARSVSARPAGAWSGPPWQVSNPVGGQVPDRAVWGRGYDPESRVTRG